MGYPCERARRKIKQRKKNDKLKIFQQFHSADDDEDLITKDESEINFPHYNILSATLTTSEFCHVVTNKLTQLINFSYSSIVNSNVNNSNRCCNRRRRNVCDSVTAATATNLNNYRTRTRTLLSSPSPSSPLQSSTTSPSSNLSQCLFRNSLGLYAASSVILVLCYLTVPIVASTPAHPM